MNKEPNTVVASPSPHPRSPANTFVYKGVLVIWDEDRDERVLAFIDRVSSRLPREGWSPDNQLVSVREHKGALELRWRAGVPPTYAEGMLVDVLTDSWYVESSTRVGGWPGVKVLRRIKKLLLEMGKLSPAAPGRFPQIVFEGLSDDDLSALFDVSRECFKSEDLASRLLISGEAYDLYKSAAVASYYTDYERKTVFTSEDGEESQVVERRLVSDGHVNGLVSDVKEMALEHFKALEILASTALDAEWVALIARIGGVERKSAVSL